MRAHRIGFLIAVGILAAGSLAGCDNDGAPEIDVTASNYCEEVAKVACYNVYRCCTEGEIEGFNGVEDVRTEAECVTDTTIRCEREIAALTWSIAEGRLSFEGSVMTPCLEALITPVETCATVYSELPWADACEEPFGFVGTVPNGSQCYFSYECAGGENSYCTPSRVCAAKPTQGMPCGSGCAPAYYCDVGTCAARLGAGGLCIADEQCAEDLFCDIGGTGMCTPLKLLGEACTENDHCDSGRCVPGQCSHDATESCFMDADCATVCEDDLSQCFGQDSVCNPGGGTCAVGGAVCFSDGACGVNGPCNFTVQCVPQTCGGTIVCGDNTVLVNYCSAFQNQVPGI
jgi:hypothetical protein